MGLELFTICAKISGAECTVVPLANDLPQVPVAAHRMCEVTKIRCFDVDEQLSRAREHSLMYLRGHLVTFYLRKDCPVRVQRDIDICKIVL